MNIKIIVKCLAISCCSLFIIDQSGNYMTAFLLFLIRFALGQFFHKGGETDILKVRWVSDLTSFKQLCFIGFRKILLLLKLQLMSDKALNCLTFLLRLNFIDTHQSIDEIGTVIEILLFFAVSIFPAVLVLPLILCQHGVL